jgi:hypothetical protein
MSLHIFIFLHILILFFARALYHISPHYSELFEFIHPFTEHFSSSRQIATGGGEGKQQLRRNKIKKEAVKFACLFVLEVSMGKSITFLVHQENSSKLFQTMSE